MHAHKLLDRWNKDPKLQHDWAAFWASETGRLGFEVLRELLLSPAAITGNPQTDGAQFCYQQGGLSILENIRTIERPTATPQPLPKEWAHKAASVGTSTDKPN